MTRREMRQLHNAACETHGLTREALDKAGHEQLAGSPGLLASLSTRQRIERSTAHIANKQERARLRFNLWAAEPDPKAQEMGA